MEETNYGSGSNGKDVGALGAKTKQVSDDLGRARASTRAWFSAASDQAERLLAAKPYKVAAIAAGVGYVLGGGLASRITRAALLIGVQLVVRQLAAGALLGQMGPASDEPSV